MLKVSITVIIESVNFLALFMGIIHHLASLGSAVCLLEKASRASFFFFF